MSKQVISEKAQERMFGILLKRPDNLVCADCSAKGPRWVSLDYGVFICMECAGAHRTLGPSVTRVRSTNIDSWLQENFDIMEAIGNATANSYWENNIVQSAKPSINSGLDTLIRFVQEKYVKKRFIPKGQCIDPKQQFIKTGTQVQPFYFDHNAQQQQQVAAVKVPLGDLLDFDHQQQEDNDFTTFQAPEQQSNRPVVFASTHSLSPEQKQVVHPPTQSLPSLDIMNLYKNTNQHAQPQTQNNFGYPQQAQMKNYAYLSSYQHQNHQQQYSQQPQQIQPQNLPQAQKKPVDIMSLYGSKI